MHSPPAPCNCLADDPAIAKAAIAQAVVITTLVDESHFMASIRRCQACHQYFLRFFCEEIDWADSEDPQTSLSIPITAHETVALHALASPPDENAILASLPGPRRFLVDRFPKREPRSVMWMNGLPFIPPHD